MKLINEMLNRLKLSSKSSKVQIPQKFKKLKSSKGSANRYEIDKRDVKLAEAHVICSRPSYPPRTLVIQLNLHICS